MCLDWVSPKNIKNFFAASLSSICSFSAISLHVRSSASAFLASDTNGITEKAELTIVESDVDFTA